MEMPIATRKGFQLFYLGGNGDCLLVSSIWDSMKDLLFDWMLFQAWQAAEKKRKEKNRGPDLYRQRTNESIRKYAVRQ